MARFQFEVWPTEHLRINQYFGVNPQNYAQFGLPGHEGIDIKAPTGSRIFCVAPGEVVRVRTTPTGHNYGIHVKVDHSDGFQTTYAHMQQALVSLGQIVPAGAVLGLADNTGNSFGSHLHLTLKQENTRLPGWPPGYIDPLPYLLPLLGWTAPTGPYVDGWVLNEAITTQGSLAQTNQGGATLRVQEDYNLHIPAGTMLVVRATGDHFTLVSAARVAVGVADESVPQPAADPPPTVSTMRGWAWEAYLTLFDNQAVAGPHGVNLRATPARDGRNLGLVRAGSSLVVHGAARDGYRPVTARRSDFLEPVALPENLPPPGSDVGPDSIVGWTMARYLTIRDGYAIVSRFGVNLRNRPSPDGANMGLVKGYATVAIAGASRGEFVPVLARIEDVINIVLPLPPLVVPDPLPEGTAGFPPPPTPLHDTTPGWVLSNQMAIRAEFGTVDGTGALLRNGPRRDADTIGYLPPATPLIITGERRGEFHPVRVDDALLGDTAPEGVEDDPDPQLIGAARLGLHASADPDISYAEHQEFHELRPDMIKLLSFHSADDIRALAEAHPQAHYVVRAFLDFGGRTITPEQFFEYTATDVGRALQALRGRDVVVELHNEPNINAEGLGSSWRSGAEFAPWWLNVLGRFRAEFTAARFLYPGLSPGSTVSGVKEDHIRFIEASRDAVDAADGLAVHCYWSDVYPMSRALDVVDDYISRFRARPIWVTEASNNGKSASPEQRAREYLRFWRFLQQRPTVRGVTYFVASASNPDFAHETWLGKGISHILGLR